MRAVIAIGLAVWALALVAGAVELLPGKVDVVLSPGESTPAAQYAADELAEHLKAVLGAEVPVETSDASERVHLYVGDSEWTRKAGINVRKLKRDAFTILVQKGNVYIAGRDDPTKDTRNAIHSPHTGAWDQLHEHATVFGAWEFLERFAGVRFYLPGDLGTIRPRQARIVVPEGAVTVRPAFLERNYSWYCDGVWFSGTEEERNAPLFGDRKLQYQRNRMQTVYIPCCHGENGFNLLDRFAETHPEYFAAYKTGARRTDKDIDFAGHLCHNSKVWDVLYEDILSYARGESPSVRGIAESTWPIMSFRKPWVDVMPQDGFTPCQCEVCRASYKTNEFHYASELIWGRTVELANRLKKAGCKMRITQMAYTPYRRIPAIEIPDNVDVMVAESGPWCVNNPKEFAREIDEIKAWSEKLGRKIWIWTYPGQFKDGLVGVPTGAPHAWAKFAQTAAPYIFGMYGESENTRGIYNQLAYYVFGKVCWDPSVDVDALIDEYHRLMFGAAAKPMAELTKLIEDKWINEIVGRLVDTPLGPVSQKPGYYEIFTRIYSPEVLCHMKELFDEAFASVAKGTLEHRRISLFAREILVPLKKESKKFLSETQVKTGQAERAAHPERRNLLINGSFDIGPTRSRRHFGIFQGSAWKGGWIGSEQDVENIEIVKLGPEGGVRRAFRIRNKGKAKTVSIGQSLNHADIHLMPEKKYRLSFFVKLEKVVSAGKGGGFGVRIWDDHNNWFPEHRITGSADWFYQQYEFVAGPKCLDCGQDITFYLWNGTGTVWINDVRLEEVDRSASDEDAMKKKGK